VERGEILLAMGGWNVEHHGLSSDRRRPIALPAGSSRRETHRQPCR
jgi:hypothetical protein